MKLFISYFLIFFVNTSLVYGGSYYVSENSRGRGNGSSYSDRMSVETHNGFAFKGGDHIYLCGEIESQLKIPRSGTSGNSISYRGYDRDPAIFTGEFRGQLYGEGKSYIDIDQVEFDGSGNDGTTGILFKNNCRYITITRCKIHDMVSNTSRNKNVGILFNNDDSSTRNSYITIGGSPGMGNEIYHIGIDTGDSDIILSYTNDVIISYNKNYGNPNRTSGIDGLTILSSKRILIEKNKFYGHDKYMPNSGFYHKSEHGEDGIDLKGATDAIIRYNVIHSNHSIGININRNASQTTDCNNILIYNNRIYENGSNVRFAGSYDDEKHSNIYVWGNVLHSARNTQNLISSTHGKNFYIYNNTFYNPLSSDRFQISASQTNFNIKNNIFIRDNSKRQLWLSGKATNYVVDGNLYYYNGALSQIKVDNDWKTATTVDKNGIDDNPRFLDKNKYDFRLASNSPAIGSGVPISGNPPSISIYGVTYHSSYAEILSSTTDWSAFPPNVNTTKQDNNAGGWVMGAYGGIKPSAKPSEIETPENLTLDP